jgi:hypothetical protein
MPTEIVRAGSIESPQEPAGVPAAASNHPSIPILDLDRLATRRLAGIDLAPVAVPPVFSPPQPPPQPLYEPAIPDSALVVDPETPAPVLHGSLVRWLHAHPASAYAVVAHTSAHGANGLDQARHEADRISALIRSLPTGQARLATVFEALKYDPRRTCVVVAPVSPASPLPPRSVTTDPAPTARTAKSTGADSPGVTTP